MIQQDPLRLQPFYDLTGRFLRPALSLIGEYQQIRPLRIFGFLIQRHASQQQDILSFRFDLIDERILSFPETGMCPGEKQQIFRPPEKLW